MAGSRFLAASEPATASIGTIIMNRPTSIASAEGEVVEGRVAGEAGEGTAVVPGARAEGIEDLGEAVRAGIGDAGEARADDGRDGGEAEKGQRQDEDGQHRHLDLPRLELFAHIFRRAPDHQAGDEDRR